MESLEEMLEYEELLEELERERKRKI